MTGVTSGVEITTLADIPSAGSGLGSSSTVTVGLLNALFTYQGRQVSALRARRAGVRDRDRAVREAHRQARPVHRRPGRHPGPPLRPRRGGESPTRVGAGRERPPRPPAPDHAVLHRGSPGARTPSWPSRMTRSRPPRSRNLTSCAIWRASRSSGFATVTWTRSARRCARAGKPSESWPAGYPTTRSNARSAGHWMRVRQASRSAGPEAAASCSSSAPVEHQRAVRRPCDT